MKHRVENPLNIFQTVLLDGKSQEVENVGFRARHGTMFTYTQTKVGFNYLYIKRKLLSDGKSTVPLDICLTPRSFICHVLVDSKNALSNEYTETIKHANGISFFCAEQLYEYLAALHHQENERAIDILHTRNIFALRIARGNYDFTRDWYKSSISIMNKVLELKLSQSHKFREELVKVGDKQVFVLGVDLFWTCGLLQRYAFWTDPNEFPGSNMLGELLCKLAAR